MKLTEILNLDELELAEAMTGPEFYNKLTSPEFKSKDTFNVTVPFNIASYVLLLPVQVIFNFVILAVVWVVVKL